MKILVINGPNLNLLGTREPEVYGTVTLDEINRELDAYAQSLSREQSVGQPAEMRAGQSVGQPADLSAERAEQVELSFFQSNHEGVLVDTIQSAPRSFVGIIYNPAAHTHYSIALRDAIAAIDIPVVEVHLSDISQREGFRAVSVISDVCIGQCMGKYVGSYKAALGMLVAHIAANNEDDETYRGKVDG